MRTIFCHSFISVFLLSTACAKNVTKDQVKSALRYGFHRTQECTNYELAFVCIQKCLDLEFDVAYADKDCQCTCYVNKVKGKYKMQSNGPTKWRHGAPTTRKPAWILPLLPNAEILNHDDQEEEEAQKSQESPEHSDEHRNSTESAQNNDDGNTTNDSSNSTTPAPNNSNSTDDSSIGNTTTSVDNNSTDNANTTTEDPTTV